MIAAINSDQIVDDFPGDLAPVQQSKIESFIEAGLTFIGVAASSLDADANPAAASISGAGGIIGGAMAVS